jgi:hypothetical protein
MKTIATSTSAPITFSAPGTERDRLPVGGAPAGWIRIGATSSLAAAGFSGAALVACDFSGGFGAAGFGIGAAVGAFPVEAGTSALIGWFLRATSGNLEQLPTAVAIPPAMWPKWRPHRGPRETGWSFS